MGTNTPWLRSGTNTQRTGPQSDYTRAVAEGGVEALKQVRQQHRHGVQGAQQNYSDTGVFSYSQPTASGDNELFNQWLSQVSPQGTPEGGYAYGQTAEGKFAGFQNQGTLQAAIRGRAQNVRGQDQEMFTALEQMANQGMDGLTSEYDTRRQENTDTERYARQIPTLPDVKPTLTPGVVSSGTGMRQPPKPSGFTYGMDDNYQPVSGPPGGDGSLDDLVASGAVVTAAKPGQARSTAEGLTRSDSAAADRYTGMAEMQAKTDYVNKDLNPWLADESAPLLEQQEFAQSGLSTPISLYAQRAGAEYGVDPNVVAGWFPETMAIGDARDQRDLAFLEQTGMTSAEYEQALNALEMEQNAAANEQGDQQTQAIDMAGYELTGGQALPSELAKTVNLPVEDVYAILDSADYQFAQNSINEALSTQDLGYIEETMISVLDGAAYTDPAMLNILTSIYRPYVPSDYDLYGSR